MNMQTPITEAVRELARQSALHGGNFQDAYREAWQAGIPPHLRKSAERWPSDASSHSMAQVQKARSKAIRSEIEPTIMALHRKGLSVIAIAKQVKASQNTIRAIIRSTGAEPNHAAPVASNAVNWAELMPAVHALRIRNVPWPEVARLTGRSKSRLSDHYREWRKTGAAQ